MFGYGVHGLDTNPYYSISHDVEGFNPETYGSLVGFWYSILFCPSLLLISPLTEKWNRKYLIGTTCMFWGLFSFLNGFATNMPVMYVLRLGVGLAQSMSGPPTYSLITDFFPPRYRVKAFFAFSIMQQVGDTMQYLTSNLITGMGWRNTWFVIGIYGFSMGLMCVLFVKEPPREIKEDAEESDDEE